SPADTKLCCSGELIRDASVRKPRVAIQRILEESTLLGPAEVDRLYSFVKDFTIGRMLRVVESVHSRGDSTLVLKVCLNGKTAKGNAPRFALDPLLLNACYFLLENEDEEPRDRIFIPMFIESLTVFRPMTETAYIVNNLR